MDSTVDGRLRTEAGELGRLVARGLRHGDQTLIGERTEKAEIARG